MFSILFIDNCNDCNYQCDQHYNIAYCHLKLILEPIGFLADAGDEKTLDCAGEHYVV